MRTKFQNWKLINVFTVYLILKNCCTKKNNQVNNHKSCYKFINFVCIDHDNLEQNRWLRNHKFNILFFNTKKKSLIKYLLLFVAFHLQHNYNIHRNSRNLFSFKDLFVFLLEDKKRIKVKKICRNNFKKNEAKIYLTETLITFKNS